MAPRPLGDSMTGAFRRSAIALSWGAASNTPLPTKMAGHEAAAGDTEFGVLLGRGLSADQFDAGPDTTGVLPPTAGAPDPLAENGPGEDDAPFVFLQRTGERGGLPGGPHEDADEGGEKVGGDGEAGALGDVVDRGHQLQTLAGSDEAFEEDGELCSGAFDSRRDDAGGDDRCFQEAEVVLRKVEDLAK